MFRASWKSLIGHKLRLFMSTFAIVLGVAFLSGSLMFTDLLSQSLNGLLRGTIADVNVGVKGQFDSTPARQIDTSRIGVTPALLRTIREVKGVSAVYGNNVGTTLYPLDKQGHLLSAPGAPTVTSNFFLAPAAGGQQGLVLKSGRAPGTDEVLLDPSTLARSGYVEGDKITTVNAVTGAHTSFTIVGTATWGSGTTFGATYMFLDDKTAKRIFAGGHDLYLTAWVVTSPSVDAATVAADINKVLPSDLEALDAATVSQKTQSTLDQGLSFVNTFLLVFAAIALIVAMFLIFNTFAIIVAQRGRELALLRALGASQHQVARSVLFEAAIVGVIGASLGIGLGWLLATGIATVMTAVGIDLGGTLPHLTSTAVVASYIVGVLATVIAAYFPALRASKVPPVAAMSGHYRANKRGLGALSVISIGLLVVGAGLMSSGLFGWIPATLLDAGISPLVCIGIGALAVLLGVAGASPLLGRPLTWLLGRLYRALFGAVGQLAELNASRNPRRTAATASALMIGLTLVVTMAILGQTSKTSLAGIASADFRGDFTVSALLSPMAPTVGDTLAKVDGVAAVYRTRSAAITLDGARLSVTAIEPDAFDKTTAQTMVSGALGEGVNSVIADESWASERGYSVGSVVEATIRGQQVPLTIDGIFTASSTSGSGSLITNLATLEAAGVPARDSSYTVYVQPGRDVADVKQAVSDAVADQPLISVNDLASITKQTTSAVDQLLQVIYALLALAVVIAVLGIVNTLALSVVERTREIGLLRAIGLTRPQLRRMITLESIVVALLGAVLGVGMGLVFGVALQRPLAEQGLDKLDIPWPLLGVFLAVSVLVGVLAALWPARRASRLDVLTAIATD